MLSLSKKFSSDSTYYIVSLVSVNNEEHPVASLTTMPNAILYSYNNKGSITDAVKYGDQSALYLNMQNENIVDGLDTYVKKNSTKWKMINIVSCKHYKSRNPFTNNNIIYFASIYNIKTFEFITNVLISLDALHPLNPSNRICQKQLTNFDGFKWLVSPVPIEFNKLYLENGLLSGIQDEQQPRRYYQLF